MTNMLNRDDAVAMFTEAQKQLLASTLEEIDAEIRRAVACAETHYVVRNKSRPLLVMVCSKLSSLGYRVGQPLSTNSGWMVVISWVDDDSCRESDHSQTVPVCQIDDIVTASLLSHAVVVAALAVVPLSAWFLTHICPETSQ